MLVTHLRLRNFRVFEDDLRLDIPPGLVGIYGPNGAGKSSLIEAIRFTLYGRTRTSIDEIRTAEVNDDCLTEVGFEHEGHRYVVRRSITGINHTVKASAFSDDLQVAEGVRDTGRYVHSVLGMDDGAFRASVFAEQKQLAAFSLKAPGERRKLVLSLLGITPVDSARDRARRDARESRLNYERMRAMTADLDALAAAVTATGEAAKVSAEAVAGDTERAEQARSAEAATATALAEAERSRQDHERIAAERRTVAEQVASLTERIEAMVSEQADLDKLRSRTEELRPLVEGREAREARLRALQAVAGARAELERVVVGPEPPPADEAALEAAQAALDEAARRTAELDGRVRAAEDDARRAEAAVVASSRLTGAEACPMCGQDLGAAFEQVQAHRAGELEEARSRQAELGTALVAAREAEGTARAVAGAAARQLRAAREARVAYDAARLRQAEARAALEAAGDGLGGEPEVPGELEALVEECRERARAAAELERLTGRLERSGRLAADLASEQARLVGARQRDADLAAQAAGLDFHPDRYAQRRYQAEQARRNREEADEALAAARVDQARTRAQAEAAEVRLADAVRLHAEVDAVAVEARHVGRVAELLSEFRNSVIATVGPRLSAQAADLFAELTDNEYDRLEVDADSYEIKIFDQGRSYGMDRFSGSETDLANLALRVAISEHVRFQAGGTVGLLVLDEVFGPLDPGRRARMLMALERLRGRFRQVLVVTHDSDVKEQLPNAIEVVKLPGRRATARVMNS